ncbi:hypothetical protein MSAN_02064800 [Mycena sanguinolenta]|uniref:Uncharacterized protein n=1 Tax=Mycena sanguinolenta TaxID=230812 RepID=A0A8H7CMP5_9AGAR|nr:hypothetical protein MSAN_02064800 [Mycena sanguinolenta]
MSAAIAESVAMKSPIRVTGHTSLPVLSTDWNLQHNKFLTHKLAVSQEQLQAAEHKLQEASQRARDIDVEAERWQGAMETERDKWEQKAEAVEEKCRVVKAELDKLVAEMEILWLFFILYVSEPTRAPTLRSFTTEVVESRRKRRGLYMNEGARQPSSSSASHKIRIRPPSLHPRLHVELGPWVVYLPASDDTKPTHPSTHPLPATA